MLMAFSRHLFSNSEVYQNDQRAGGNRTLMLFEVFSFAEYVVSVILWSKTIQWLPYYTVAPGEKYIKSFCKYWFPLQLWGIEILDTWTE